MISQVLLSQPWNFAPLFQDYSPWFVHGWGGEKTHLEVLTSGCVVVSSFIHCVFLFIHSFCSPLYFLFRNRHCSFKSSCQKQMVKCIPSFFFVVCPPPHPFISLNVWFYFGVSRVPRIDVILFRESIPKISKSKISVLIFFLPFGMLFSPNERQFTETSSPELKITFLHILSHWG